nr:hypothetical protein Cry52Nrm1_p077 [Cryptomonas curvata]
MEKISITEFDPWNVNFFKKIRDVPPINKQKIYVCNKQEDFEIASFTIDTSAWIYSCRVDNLFDFTTGFLKSLEKTSHSLSVKNKNNITKHKRFKVENLKNSNLEWKYSANILSYFLKLKKDMFFIYQKDLYNHFYLKKGFFSFYYGSKSFSNRNSIFRFKMGNLLYNICSNNNFFLNKLLVCQKKLQSKNYYAITASETFNQIETFDIDMFKVNNNLELFSLYNQKFYDEFSSLYNKDETNKNVLCNINLNYNANGIFLNFKNSCHKKNKKFSNSNKKHFLYGEKKKCDLSYIVIGFFENIFSEQKYKPFFFLKPLTTSKLNFDISLWIIVKRIFKNKIKKKKIDTLGYELFYLSGENLKSYPSKIKIKDLIGKRKLYFYSISNLEIRKNFFYLKKLLMFFIGKFEKYNNSINSSIKKNFFIKCKYLLFDLRIFFKTKGPLLEMDYNFKKNSSIYTTLFYLLKIIQNTIFFISDTKIKIITAFLK